MSQLVGNAGELAARFRCAVEIARLIKDQLSTGRQSVRDPLEEVQDGFCPRTAYGAAEGRRRAKIENHAATKGAKLARASQARRSVKAAIRAEDDSGQWLSSIAGAPQKAIKAVSDPAGSRALQPVNSAKIDDAAGECRAVEISRLIHRQAGIGSCSVLSAAEVVNYAEGLRLRRGQGDDRQRAKQHQCKVCRPQAVAKD